MSDPVKTCVWMTAVAILVSAVCGQQQRIVSCYFTNWAQYRKGVAKFLPNNVNPKLCTHIYFAFAKIDPINTTIAPIEWNDVSVLYPGVVALKGINPRLKVILSIGGYSEKESSWITISSPTRAITFSKNVISFVRRHGFDGVNLDWETPSAMTAAGFITLVQVPLFYLYILRYRGIYDFGVGTNL
ncbi:hypothetical protein BaRGS_00006294 [Batillaria attramentaria]|uniref:GH18 domain-containing protein n=1 Tax=Batillaria attramentaria TaxID=370345 RepID=A0ABD0LT29_9CAEN